MMLCTIWYHLCNLKNVEKAHGGVLILVTLQTAACKCTKVTLLHRCFSRFLNCTNSTKSHKVPDISLSLAHKNIVDLIG